MQLRCLSSGKPQIHVEMFVVGTMLKMKVECLDGLTIISCNSQPVLEQMPRRNLVCSAATMFNEETYQHIKNFSDFLWLSYVGKSVYFDIQRKILLTIVDNSYNQHIKEVHQQLNGRDTFLA